MLVLSRKQNQEIVIGDGIKITVLKIKGNTIRLGIDAPKDVKVIRGELSSHPNPNRGNNRDRQPSQRDRCVQQRSCQSPAKSGCDSISSGRFGQVGEQD